ncbi:Oligopeptide transport system permease protein OppB (TC 3.A.1.5.1) [hydrothermal vent metagenome]|uniref:Oligopeptide transport system permease protein OppB (TC 3.A.1.5.1) n=1 Tax=hydrothermal vent metagenome TaxID=652676 RepID=A0A3B1A2J8_9ZZZZ
MLTYLARRLLLMIPTLFGITLVVFTVMAASPGGLSVQSLVDTQGLEPEARKALEDYYNKLYGLDQPAPVQYLRWINNISPIGFTFDDEGSIDSFSFTKGVDLGRSLIYGRPVTELLKERVPITLLLNVLTIPIIYLIAISIGVRAATKRGELFDVGSGLIMLGLWSVPTMLAGVLLMGYFSNDQFWHIFPTSGLSYREAYDMPFLPHWSNAFEPIKLLLSFLVGGFVLVYLSIKGQRRVRAILMGLLGLVLGGLFAANMAGETGWVTFGLITLFIAALFYALGDMEYASFRTLSMGLLGIFVGGYVASLTLEGEFVRGFLVDRIWHLVLPVATLTYGGFAFLTKLARTSVLENLLSDYARTARAKGASEHDVLWRHVFRNSLLPLITVAAALLPGLLGGSVIVESIFSIDGMGKLSVEAVKSKDREVVLAVTLIGGLLTLVGYLIADLFYAIADPRVSYD